MKDNNNITTHKKCDGVINDMQHVKALIDTEKKLHWYSST